MTIKISQAAGAAGVAAIGALLNSGTIEIYSGTQPANPDTALSGNTLLATFDFDATAFGSPSLVSSKEQIAASLSASTVVAAATGTATFARLFDSSHNAIADYTVGTSGTDIVLNSTSITSGGNVTLSSFHLNMPVD